MLRSEALDDYICRIRTLVTGPTAAQAALLLEVPQSPSLGLPGPPTWQDAGIREDQQAAAGASTGEHGQRVEGRPRRPLSGRLLAQGHLSCPKCQNPAHLGLNAGLLRPLPDPELSERLPNPEQSQHHGSGSGSGSEDPVQTCDLLLFLS